MKNMISKVFMAVLAAAMVVAVLPVTSAYAADENPPAAGEVTEEQLEQAWERQLKAYERMGRTFEDVDARIAKMQEMIDKAADNGRDVAALQSALDAYEEALLAARPAYNSINGIVNSHQGFDADGSVTDFEKAKSTVVEMREKMKEIREETADEFKALRDAFKAFRETRQERGSRPGG